MAAYGDNQAVSSPPGGAGTGAGFGTWNLPNFVGELFKLSPLETPLLSLIGGMTGGRPAKGVLFSWQDTLHQAPATQANDEGADATFRAQYRVQRFNTVEIFQYGTEVSYSKQGGTDKLGTMGGPVGTGVGAPTIADDVSILGNQPVQDEVSWQMQVLLEQAGIDIEWAFLNETLAVPNDGTARKTQGIVGAVSTDTTTDYTTTQTPFGRAAVNDLSKKLYDNGAPMRNCVIMVNSQPKLDLGNSYQVDGTAGWNVQPRSYNIFGVNVTDIETEFGRYPVVLNRHVPQTTALILELDVMAPRFLPIPGKGHFFMEPLAKSGSYDREQLYGEIGLEYGPAGWHAKAVNLNTGP